MADVFAPGQRQAVTLALSPRDKRKCPVCSETITALDLDAVMFGAAFERGIAPVPTAATVTFEADRVTLQPCGHTYDTATKRWGRR